MDPPLNELKCQTFEYEDAKQSSDVLKWVSDFLLNNSYTDVEIVIDEERIPCHQLILCAVSPYYRALFQHEENRTLTLPLPGIRADVFKKLLNFMYTSKITITTDDVMEILELADFLQLRKIVNYCSGIILQNININSVIPVLLFADAHSCQSVIPAAKAFLKENIHKVLQADEFVLLGIDTLNEILSDPSLCIESEVTLLHAICRWVDKEKEQRIKYVPTLLKFVHLEDVRADDCAKHLALFPFLKNSNLDTGNVAETVETINSDLDTGNVGDTVETMNSDLDTGNVADKVETMNSDLDTEHDTDTVETMKNGLEFRHGTDTLETIDTEATRKEVTSKRAKSCVVLVPQSFHTHNDRSLLFYHSVEDEWRMLTDVPFLDGVESQRVAVLQNMIYMTGGKSGRTEFPCNRVWRYNALTDKWCKSASMLRARVSHAITNAGKYLYAFGGDATDEHGIMYSGVNTLERYDPVADRWEMMNTDTFPSQFTVGNASLVHLGDKLYVIGGMQSSRPPDHPPHRHRPLARQKPTVPRVIKHQTVECYNMESGRWEDADELAQHFVEHAVSHLSNGMCLPYSGLLLIMDEARCQSIKVYDPVTRDLHEYLPTSGQHQFGSYIIQDAQFYAVGGLTFQNHTLGPHDLAHCLSLTEEGANWKMIAPLPYALSHYAAVAVGKYLD